MSDDDIQRLAELVSRLEAVASQLEQQAARGRRFHFKGVAGGVAGGVAEYVEEHASRVLGGKLKTYLELSARIGGEVGEQAEMVGSAFLAQHEFLVMASQHKMPKPAVLQELLRPISDEVSKVQEFCDSHSDSHRDNQLFNQLKAVREGCGCTGWVTVSPRTAVYVKEMGDQAMFYGNRVLREFKGKDETYVEWIKAFTGAIRELQEYVSEFHPTGLTWNPDGAELEL